MSRLPEKILAPVKEHDQGMRVATYLQGWGTGAIEPENHGVCANLYNREGVTIKTDCLRGWEHYTGDPFNPVERIGEHYEPWEGAEGELRKDLCMYLSAGLLFGRMHLTQGPGTCKWICNKRVRL